MATPSNILLANLAQLRKTEPELARRILEATPAELEWLPSRAGPLSAVLKRDGKTYTLASRFDPLAEADKLLTPVDYQKHGGIVLLGMGLGHQVTRVVQQMSKDCLLIIFEPDTAILRAVLERIDYTTWLGSANIVLVDGVIDRAGMVSRVEKYAAIITQGTVLITHPVSRTLFSEAISNFSQIITDTLAYCRTTVATSLVNGARTIANLSMNIGHYAAGATTDELHRYAAGTPAVCVGAGPSLARNVHLLADPLIRSRVVVISAQTTLKPLLDRGIQPDFVTALDYHEISARFYEGLPELPDVTLVAEAKVNPSVIDTFPGPIRCTQNNFLDRILGSLAQPRVQIRGGATVAHLSFYLAQHLGCDPIILIGQDLGFSDGLYYCPGTAIHDVWAPELGAFNTLEMMEWQRIVRHRNHLQKVEDIHGRPAYSDEQMLTYLKQFERDFADAPQTVIDATEGGLPKDHTTRMNLADALAAHAIRPAPRVPLPVRGLDPRKLAAINDLLEQLMTEVHELRQLTKKTVPLLHQMIEHQRDMERMNKLFQDLDRNKKKVDRMPRAFGLVNDLNSIGAFKRARADRAIQNSGGSVFEKQTRQIERDLENLNWLVQGCDEATTIFRNALSRVQAQRKTTGNTQKGKLPARETSPV